MRSTAYEICKYAGAILVAGLLACGTRTDQPTVSKTPGDVSTAAPGKDAAKRDKALIRLVNADPQTKGAELWFGDSMVIKEAAFRTAGSYVEVPAEVHQFRARTAGSGSAEPLATNNERLVDGRRYTLILWRDEKGKAHLESVADDLKTMDAGKTKVRVIHAAPALKDVDIAEAGTTDLFSGVDPAESTSFKEIAPFHGNLQVRRAGKKAPPLLTAPVNLEAGKHYTIVLVPRGPKDMDRDPIVIVDQLS